MQARENLKSRTIAKGGSACTSCYTDYNSNSACSLNVVPWSGSVERQRGAAAWSGSENNSATFVANSYASPSLVGAVVADNFQCEQNQFLAVGYGSISSIPIFDVWTMDQNCVFTMVQAGY